MSNESNQIRRTKKGKKYNVEKKSTVSRGDVLKRISK